MKNNLIETLKKHPKVLEACIQVFQTLLEKDEADDVENYYKIGEFYYFWDDLEYGYTYGKLEELDSNDNIPFCVELPSDIRKIWYKNASKELPKN